MSTGVTFHRRSDMAPRQDELLRVDGDGTFTLWRSTGEVVGEFAGSLDRDDPLLAHVRAAAGDARPAAPNAVPDASVDRLTIDGCTLAISADDDLEGPWGAALARCRALHVDLRAHPRAAIALDITDPAGPRLVHVGDRPIRVALIQPVARVTAWRDSSEVAAGRGWAQVVETVEATPGWSLEIPVDVEVPSGARAVVEVGFDAYRDGDPIPVTLYATGDPRP